MTEEWREIPGCPGYQASSFGQVRSLDRVVTRKDGRQAFNTGRVLKLSQTIRNGRAYLQVKVTPLGAVKVQHLVAEAFIGPRNGRCVLHKDDNPKNNQISNLYYGDHSDNTNDMVRNGNHNQARKTHCKNGHEFSPENTRVIISGDQIRRRCIQCDRAKQTKYNHKRRGNVTLQN